MALEFYEETKPRSYSDYLFNIAASDKNQKIKLKLAISGLYLFTNPKEFKKHVNYTGAKIVCMKYDEIVIEQLLIDVIDFISEYPGENPPAFIIAKLLYAFGTVLGYKEREILKWARYR